MKLDTVADTVLSLSPIRRIALALLGLVVLPVSLFPALIGPAIERRETALDALDVSRREAQSVLAFSARPGTSARHVPLGISDVESRLADLGLTRSLADLTLLSNGNMRIELTDITFSQMADWLWTLAAKRRFVVLQMDVSETEQPGILSVMAFLQPDQP